MAVLSDVDIRKSIENDEGIIIINKSDENITGVGYDLTIGFICDSDTGEKPKFDPNTHRYVLLPRRRYLVVSREFIRLPPQYMATLHSRGSYALKGLVVLSTTIDPNYIGCVYVSLMNCSRNEVKIKKNNQFATMVIHSLLTSTETPLAKNERGKPKDAQETLNSKFSTIHEKTITEANGYDLDNRKGTEYEYSAALKRTVEKSARKEELARTQQYQKEQPTGSEMQQQNEMYAQIEALSNKLEQIEASNKKEKRRIPAFSISILIADVILFSSFVCYVRKLYIGGIILGIIAFLTQSLAPWLALLVDFTAIASLIKGVFKKSKKE